MSRTEAVRGTGCRRAGLGLVALTLGWGSGPATAQLPAGAQVAPPPEVRQGRELLMHKQFPEALKVFVEYLRSHPGPGHPGAVQAELGIGDAQLGMHEYEAAETTYRHVTAEQPELWQAHKNLVVVEAALHRWEEFDRERTVLRLARERGAPGISARESDVIDNLDVRGQRWVVRAYFEPVGRSQARYNFERFSPEGRVEAYISLEDPEGARQALAPADVRIGVAPSPQRASNEGALALNWYTGAAHGSIRHYPDEPHYERLRADVVRWLETHPAMFDPGPKR